MILSPRVKGLWYCGDASTDLAPAKAQWSLRLAREWSVSANTLLWYFIDFYLQIGFLAEPEGSLRSQNRFVQNVRTAYRSG